MRGNLALWIVLLHLGFNSFARRTFGWPGIAFELAVDVFFILSGFVLSHSLRRGSGIAAFAIRRCFRLLPVSYLIALAAALPLGRPLPLADWLVAAPFTGRQPLNFPAWSIGWELYLPLAVVLVRLEPPRWMVRPLQAIVLAAGALLYRARLEAPGPVEGWFALLVLGMAEGQAFPLMTTVVLFAATAAILAGRTGKSLFATAPLQWLGAISYTLDMIHIPVPYAAQALLGARIDANPPAKLGILAVSIAAAAVLTLAVERPANRLGHRLSRRIAARQGLASQPAQTIGEP